MGPPTGAGEKKPGWSYFSLMLRNLCVSPQVCNKQRANLRLWCNQHGTCGHVWACEHLGQVRLLDLGDPPWKRWWTNTGLDVFKKFLRHWSHMGL